MKFPCTSCGMCCRAVAHILPAEMVSPAGDCIHLGANNRCGIYAERPEVCSVNRMYYRHSAKGGVLEGISKADYYEVSAGICNDMQEGAGIPESFRVKVGGKMKRQ